MLKKTVLPGVDAAVADGADAAAGAVAAGADTADGAEAAVDDEADAGADVCSVEVDWEQPATNPIAKVRQHPMAVKDRFIMAK
jgi:hypothetical protein